MLLIKYPSYFFTYWVVSVWVVCKMGQQMRKVKNRCFKLIEKCLYMLNLAEINGGLAGRIDLAEV